MNIKINEEEFNNLVIFRDSTPKLVFGSYLYGTNKSGSDLDYMIILKHYPFNLFETSRKTSVVQFRHHFQYKKGNKDYVFSTWEQFYRNLYDGESTINSDIVLFNPYFNELDTLYKLTMLRTYNIIKCYLGMAKRDIKQAIGDKKEKKLLHAARGLIVAEELISCRLPTKDMVIKSENLILDKNPDKYLLYTEKNLRWHLNRLLDEGKIVRYPLFNSPNSLFLKMMEASNKTEFYYD